MDNSAFQQDYINHTVLHPLGLLAMVILCGAVLLLPRRYAVLPFLVMACFISPAQRVVIASLNFDLLRVMVLAGTVRLLLWNEWRDFCWKPLDFALLAWGALHFITLNLLYADPSALKYSLGAAYDVIGFYFLFRTLVRSWQDVNRIVIGFIVISIPVAMAFLLEHATGRNMFAIFGGVSEMTDIREGRLRCQGAFAHAILAGCFWASLLPLMVAQWWRKGYWYVWAIVGVVDSLIIIAMCTSSTPVLAVIAVIAGTCLYPLRNWMRWIRWGMLIAVIGLQLAMTNPIWHLFNRVAMVGGSTGWHRFNLIQQAVIHINEWWLIGSDRGTAHWGYGLFDVTNHYLVQGLHGGLGLLALFIVVIATGFWSVGRCIKCANGNRQQIRLAWALGVSLFVHALNFLAVSYFGQINMVWYLLLAMIASLTPVSRSAPRVVYRQYLIRRTNPHHEFEHAL